MKTKPKPKNGNGKKLSKSSAKLIIIICFAVFGIVWVKFISPALQYSHFYLSLNPVGAYIIYNLGFLIVFSALIGVPLAYFVIGDVNILNIIRGGLATFVLASWLWDLMQPPWAWNPDGTLAIIPTADNMETSAVDYMWGWVFEQFGIQGHLLYQLVMYAVPIFAVIVIAVSLKPQKAIKILTW